MSAVLRSNVSIVDLALGTRDLAADGACVSPGGVLIPGWGLSVHIHTVLLTCTARLGLLMSYLLTPCSV